MSGRRRAEGPTRRSVSFWWDQLGVPDARPCLSASRAADVVIVGGGYTGLWAAYYLKQARPEREIVVLEAGFAGSGASGRNGGWLSNSIPGGHRRYEGAHPQAVVDGFQHAFNATLDEVVDVAAREGIDADLHRGGRLIVATNDAQLGRLTAYAAAEAVRPGADCELLPAAQLAERVRVRGALGGVWSPHCARLHPAKLARGLAEAVERLGVTIYEHTVAERIETRAVHTREHVVSAPVVIRATEGFTSGLAGERRTWLPMNSSMIITEPLGPEIWEQIGWSDSETLADLAHAYVYAQRTAGGRIALGGRGVPYRYGSRVPGTSATDERTVSSLADVLHRLLPATAEARTTHAWSGVLGVARDWRPSVGFDPATGRGWAGGYVGNGVTAANLAGRTLRDLVLRDDTELVRMPWVGHDSPRWEVEPLRWLAVRALYAAYRAADRAEHRGRATTSPLARAADLISSR